MGNMKLLFMCIAIFLGSCEQLKDESTEVSTKDILGQEVFGWFHGACFATSQSNLSKGTRIFVVVLNDPQSTLKATIRGLATVKNCTPLTPDRQKQNHLQGLFFYETNLESSFDLAIGVIGEVSQPHIGGKIIKADIGNNGVVEYFTHCATAEGISFSIRNSTPYETKPLWSGYYYLGYDVERTCP